MSNRPGLSCVRNGLIMAVCLISAACTVQGQGMPGPDTSDPAPAETAAPNSSAQSSSSTPPPASNQASAAPKPAPSAGVIPGWQLTPANTGLARIGLNCNTLPLYTGATRPAAGSVISGKRIQSGLDLSAGNVTIERSCVQPRSVAQGMHVITTTDYNK